MADAFTLPRLGASACVWRGERVLIVQRGKPPLVGIWSLPGGSVELGETVREAATREVAEETGITCSLTTLVDIVDVIRRDAAGDVDFHYAIACFAGNWVAGEPHPQNDVLATRFVDIGDINSLDMTEGTPEIIMRSRHLLGY